MRQLSIIVGLFAAFLLVEVASGQALIFEHDGLDRRYRLHLPDDLPENAPLVLVLHGYGGGGAGMQNNYGWTELADEMGFAAVFPDGTRDQWNSRFWQVGYEFHTNNDVDDDSFLVALVQALQTEHDLDPDRTFVTGLSNGGDMSYQLACRHSEVFAGFAPVVGTMMESLYVDCNPTQIRPILAMNGTDDDITLFDGDMDNSDGWGAYRPVPDVVELWSEIMETSILRSSTLPNTAPNDGSIIEFDRYQSKNHPCQFWFYRVVGGGHDWPGQYGNMDIDATREIWDFFAAIETDSPSNPADLNGDGFVNAADLGLMLGGWGIGSTIGDLNGDGNTDSADVGLLLSNWTG